MKMYFTIPESNAYDKLPPKMLAKEIYKVIDALNNEVTVEPNWIQYQERNKAKMGAPNVYRKYQGDKFLIIGFEPSALGGILTELEGLGTGVNPPVYTVWTSQEINAFGWDVDEQV